VTLERLAHDLRTTFPQMKGFSRANLMYMRAFAETWPDGEFVQAVLAQLPSSACVQRGNSQSAWADPATG
jgi:hypothetical protein